MKALTIWQPWASLTMLEDPSRVKLTPTGNQHESGLHEYTGEPVRLKWIETRSWPAPKSVIGQRIAIHASVRWPTATDLHILSGPFPNIATRPSVDPHGAQPRLPLGAIIGTAVLDAAVPMESILRGDPPPSDESLEHGHVLYLLPDSSMSLVHRWEVPPIEHDVSDQAPFGIFAQGRWAWLLADARPLAQPITCKGKQGLWNVPADIEERLRG